MEKLAVNIINRNKPLVGLKTSGVYAPPHKQVNVFYRKTQLFQNAYSPPFETVGLHGWCIKAKTLCHQGYRLGQRRAGGPFQGSEHVSVGTLLC